MTLPDPLGFGLGLLLPAIVLGGLAIFVPRALFVRMKPTLFSVGLNLLASGFLLVLAGAVCFAMMYALQAPGVGGALLAEPVSAIAQFLKLGISSSLIWAPILLLVGFGLAQRTEA